MNNDVYKSDEGRRIIETAYRRVLETYTAAPFEELFVPTEIARTHVLRFGDASGEPLVMLHGSASNSAAWLGNAADFTDRFCVYCADIPGEPGLSEPVRCDLTSDSPHRWLVSLLDALGIERASFVTMSLGSWYALNLTIQSPHRVSALSMITTPGIVPARAGFIFKALLFMILGKTGQKLLNRMISHKAILPHEALEFQALVSRHFNTLTAPIPIFTDEELGRITAPLQFFGGDHDALIDSVKTAGRLKEIIPSAEVHILEDTGHVILDQFRTIKEFMVAH